MHSRQAPAPRPVVPGRRSLRRHLPADLRQHCEERPHLEGPRPPPHQGEAEVCRVQQQHHEAGGDGGQTQDAV